jgi:hypothetical protein
MQALPGRQCPDRIDDYAKPPEDSFVPPDGTPLDAPDSPRVGDQPSLIVCAPGRSGVSARFGSRAGHELTAALRASVRRHRRAQGGSPMLRSIRPTRAVPKPG